MIPKIVYRGYNNICRFLIYTYNLFIIFERTSKSNLYFFIFFEVNI